MEADGGTRRRPKGFISWRPQHKSKVLLDQIMQSFELHKNEWPLTARQVYYIMNGNFGYPKDTKETKGKNYNRLLELLVRARRAQIIPFGMIRDDSTRLMAGTQGYLGEDMFWRRVERTVSGYLYDPSWNQPYSIEVWCETHGMIPQLSRVVGQYGVPVYSNSGFTSVTATYDTACRIVRDYRPTIFLHIGDYDPSGQSIFESMSEDISTFVAQFKGVAESGDLEEEWGGMSLAAVEEESDFIYHRVALTEDQVKQYALPLQEANPSDSRTARWVGGVAQAEALPPDILASTLREAVLEFYDLDIAAENQIQADMDKHYLKETFDVYLPDWAKKPTA